MSEQVNQVNHLAIIMDGNGRWAQSRGLGRSEGHRAGADNVLRIARLAGERGVKYLTLYAFSTENWKRPAGEVDTLMKLLYEFATRCLEELHELDIKLQVIGDMSALPEESRVALEAVIEASAKNNGCVLNLALNYGGRSEIALGARRFAEDVQAGKISIDDLDEKRFSEYLYTGNMPDPELVIRTSGELRISNFLLWQIAYSELYVTDVLWPDFDEKELDKALESFAGRSRRFGGVEKK